MMRCPDCGTSWPEHLPKCPGCGLDYDDLVAAAVFLDRYLERTERR